jgi:hypothetical protein
MTVGVMACSASMVMVKEQETRVLTSCAWTSTHTSTVPVAAPSMLAARSAITALDDLP